MDKEPKKKAERKKFTVEQEIEAVLEKHGYVDYAVVVRSVDSITRGFWVAGDGENPSGDRERAGQLYFEMGVMQASLLEHFSPKLRPI